MYTSGSITIEDGQKKAEEYAPARKVAITLNFDVAEGADVDAVRKQVTADAQKFWDDAFGGQAENKKRTRSKLAEDTNAATVHNQAQPGPSVAETHEKNNAAIVESSKVTAQHMSDKEKLAQAQFGTKQPETVKPAADPAAMTDETANAGGDGLDDLLGEKPPVSDADLNAAITAKNKEIADPVRIRGVIAKYNGGPGKVVADIPQAQRHTFLDELKALKKA